MIHRKYLAISEKNNGFEREAMRCGNAGPGAIERGATPCAGVIHTHANTRSEVTVFPSAHARSMCSRYCVCTNNTTRRRADDCGPLPPRCDVVRRRVARVLEPARNFSRSAGESNAKDRSGWKERSLQQCRRACDENLLGSRTRAIHTSAKI